MLAQRVEGAKIPYKVLDDNVETTTGKGSISTCDLANGLEFRTVVLMACDDEIIPLQERIETVADDGISRRSATQNGTCCMSPALAHGIICW